MVSFSYLNSNAVIRPELRPVFLFFNNLLISFAITFSIPVGFLPGTGGFPFQVKYISMFTLGDLLLFNKQSSFFVFVRPISLVSRHPLNSFLAGRETRTHTTSLED